MSATRKSTETIVKTGSKSPVFVPGNWSTSEKVKTGSRTPVFVPLTWDD